MSFGKLRKFFAEDIKPLIKRSEIYDEEWKANILKDNADNSYLEATSVSYEQLDNENLFLNKTLHNK